MNSLQPNTAIRARLEITGPDGRRSIELQGQDPRDLGRSPRAQIRLRDAAVSRRHAELIPDAQGQWAIRDVGSRNGTIVNGAPVRAQQRLRPGDVIRIGPFVLRLRQDIDSPHPSASQPTDLASQHTSVLTMSDSELGRVQRLEEFPPANINILHHDMLSELGNRLAELDDEQACCRELCELLVHPEFRGRTALVLRIPDDGQSPPVMLGQQVCSERWRDDPPHVSRTLLKAAVSGGTAVMASGVTSFAAPGGGAIDVAQSIDVRQLAAIACPLSLSNSQHGVLYVTLPAEQGTGDWLALVSLAAKQFELAHSNRRIRAADIREAAMKLELARARQVQARLLPTARQIAAVSQLDLAISFQPCLEVGGDYLDVIPMPDGQRVLLIIADVSGKGLAAALVSSILHTAVHAAVRAQMPLQTMFLTLNEHLCQYLDEGMFATAAAVCIEPASGEFQTVNAGHPPLFILSPDASVRQLTPSLNCVLGLPQPRIESTRDRLASHELLLMYTDGLSEIADANGQMLGCTQLADELRALRRANPTADLDALAQLLRDRLNQLQPQDRAADDRTFLLARLAGPGCDSREQHTHAVARG
ncbi:SpoIIE family protein phosphatase [Fontivita pretiosa]|uniref:SpoIIE family protein phosphatase n=1 Tax=Fontivita pretiosa TaxID=2989684 RepID=UPI003D185A72